MSWYSFPPYVSAAERRQDAAAALKKLSKQGRKLAPVKIEGRNIASTFWGKAWCTNLEAYSDFANRLPRGRSYARNGSVIDLQITGGKIEALVQGSSLYTVSISVSPLKNTHWQEFKSRCSGQVTNLLDLLRGQLSREILSHVTARGDGLFPAPKELTLQCSCPDGAMMCKHVAAVLYGIGARLDSQPELFFLLRAVEMQELISAASAEAMATPSATPTLDDASLSDIFGVEIETAASSPAAPTPLPRMTPYRPSRKKAAKPKARSAAKETTVRPKPPKKATAQKARKAPVQKRLPKPKKAPKKTPSANSSQPKARRRNTPAPRG